MTRRPGIHEILTSLAGRQHGVVTRTQLLEAGLSSHQVQHRRSTGQLVPLHRGVYRVGPVELPRARDLAAVLACGKGAVVSHRSAARLWGIVPPGGPRGPVDVAVRGGFRRRPGLRVHRLSTLESEDVTRVEGIPVTKPSRTLWDLAGSDTRRGLEAAVAAGLDRGLVRPAQLRALLDRHRGAPGSRRLRALLDSGATLTRSEAEARFLDLVRQARLPEPRANHRVEGVEVDFYWRSARLVVEVDGFAYHGSVPAFEADRRRDARLVAAGLRVLRVTWRQLTGEPLAVISRVSMALGRSAGP